MLITWWASARMLNNCLLKIGVTLTEMRDGKHDLEGDVLNVKLRGVPQQMTIGMDTAA